MAQMLPYYMKIPNVKSNKSYFRIKSETENRYDEEEFHGPAIVIPLHIDRQVWKVRIGEVCERRYQKKIGWPSLNGSKVTQSQGNFPSVSYTHLDVYKRQILF